MVGDLSNFKSLSETRYCGTGAVVIQTDDQMLLAQQCIGNLRKVLLEARKVHPSHDYLRMAEPILLEIQQCEQELDQRSGTASGELVRKRRPSLTGAGWWMAGVN
jgi:hypothetical protein